jgi:hypothetical protein
MGSSGTGRLSDYPGSGRGKRKKKGSGGQGGSSGKDPCKQSFTEQLEDVATCDFFKKHGRVPSQGTRVKVVGQKRVAVSTLTGETIGYLPTQLNYLMQCLAAGFKYTGKVETSTEKPIPAVVVELDPK